MPLIALGATYLTPAGVTCTPLSAGADLVVRYWGATFSFTRVVRRADFAAYRRTF